MRYKQFSKARFEMELIRMRHESDIGYWCIVNDELDDAVFEYVYCIKTRNRSLDILIYSSIDLDTNKTRDYGSDAVRIVYRWNTKRGVLYHRVKKLLRVENLFVNMEDSLYDASEGCFQLGELMWVEGGAI